MESEKINIKIAETDSPGRSNGCDAGLTGEMDGIMANFDAALRIYDAVRARIPSGSTQSPAGPSTPQVVPGVVPITAVQRAQAALANFVPSRVPDEVRADATYLRPGDDLKKSQQAVIQRNLTKLTDSKTERSLRLGLSSQDLAVLEVATTNMNGPAGGTVDLGKLLGFVESRLQGNELYADGNLPAAALAAEAEADKRIKRITNPGE